MTTYVDIILEDASRSFLIVNSLERNTEGIRVSPLQSPGKCDGEYFEEVAEELKKAIPLFSALLD